MRYTSRRKAALKCISGRSARRPWRSAATYSISARAKTSVLRSRPSTTPRNFRRWRGKPASRPTRYGSTRTGYTACTAWSRFDSVGRCALEQHPAVHVLNVAMAAKGHRQVEFVGDDPEALAHTFFAERAEPVKKTPADQRAA